MSALLSFFVFGLAAVFGYGAVAAAREWWDCTVTAEHMVWRYANRGAQHKPPCWWWWLAQRYAPARCREVPCATEPDRVLLRQVALWSRHVYLQQFASSEEFDWFHSHQWRWTAAFGLWGEYVEQRLTGTGRIHESVANPPLRVRTAPYAYAMSSAVAHHVLYPSAGHTSIFVGLWRDDNLKHYYPAGQARRWEDHIQRMVERI